MITDTLREYIEDEIECGLDLDTIADNIDNCLESHYMELPRDKNGKYIHIGDTTSSGYAITGIVFDKKVGNAVLYDRINGNLQFDWTSSIELVEPDTQEKIDVDAELHPCRYWKRADNSNSCKTCNSPNKDECSCMRQQMKDLLRRQRELDGVK